MARFVLGSQSCNVTFETLSQCIKENVFAGDRIGIVIPTSVNTAVALLSAIYNGKTAIPLYHMETKERYAELITNLEIDTIVTTQFLFDTIFKQLQTSNGVSIYISSHTDLTVHFTRLRPRGSMWRGSASSATPVRASMATLEATDTPAQADTPAPAATPPCLVLQTSGTSGQPKIVSYTLDTLNTGACMVIKSWKLGASDTALCMMPLYHIAGIVRLLFAPILSGGRVFISEFDTNAFWDALETRGITWYFASPTMHLAFLRDDHRRGPEPSNPESQIRHHHNLRLITNAAGGLQPALAQRLYDTFKVPVLPSYGMTECMPIATPGLDYRLDKPGSSGRSCGPEIAIFDLDTFSVLEPHLTIGRIAVRGKPVFSGYTRAESSGGTTLRVDRSAFNEYNFFDTGDIGYLDIDGDLFVTGRSKEVINRGGEILSPVEIESAIGRIQGVSDVIAFSVPHALLQECVGVGIVMEPGHTRISERDLRMSSGLSKNKLPLVIVYLNTIPKTVNNKVLRVSLAKRLQITADSNTGVAYYQATIPLVCKSAVDPSTFITEPIVPDFNECVRILKESALQINAVMLGSSTIAIGVPSDPGVRVDTTLSGLVDHYNIPEEILIYQCNSSQRMTRIATAVLMDAALQIQEQDHRTQTCSGVIELVSFVSGLPVEHIRQDTDFTALGIDSILIGRLSTVIRRRFPHAKVTAITLMQLKNARGVADYIDNTSHHTVSPTPDASLYEYDNTVSTARYTLPLLSIGVIRPIRIAIRFFIFAYTMAVLAHESRSNLKALVLVLVCIGVAELCMSILLPFVGIVSKYAIVFRYTEKSEPINSTTYNKFWICDQILRVCGRGIFALNSDTFRWYLVMLGAKIHRTSVIDTTCDVGEFDLISIGENCVFHEDVSIRCVSFATRTDGGRRTPHIQFDRIVIDDSCVFGTKSVVTPGSNVQSGGYVSPGSTSTDDPRIQTRTVESSTILPGFVYALRTLLYTVSSVPWILAVYTLVTVDLSTNAIESFSDVVVYLGTPLRLVFHTIAILFKDILIGLVYTLLTIPVKRLCIGRKTRTASDVLLSRIIFGDSLVNKTLTTFGSHYGFTAFYYRAMGATVGTGVYFPGTPLKLCIHDALVIGNSVVFGSRTVIQPDEGPEGPEGAVGTVVFEDSCMIADRCIIQGNVRVTSGSILGTGSIGVHDNVYSGIYIGNYKGEPVQVSNLRFGVRGPEPSSATPTATPTRSPFAIRMERDPWISIVLPAVNVFFACVVSMYNSLCILVPIQVCRAVAIGDPDSHRLPLVFLFVVIAAFSVQLVVALGISILGKWALIGHRTTGRYNWDTDTSNYNIRWQMSLLVFKIAQDSLDYIRGTQWILWYYRALGLEVEWNQNVLLYPIGMDPGMTEPDLVSIGKATVISKSSVVCHLNTMGNFDLNRIDIGNGCILQSHSRLLSGGEIEDNVILEYKSLVSSGDIVSSGSVVCGWPMRI